MAKQRDPMRRHFCITVWKDAEESNLVIPESGVRDFTIEIERIVETARMCKAHYVAWSLEDAALEKDDTQDKEIEGLHFHVYIECLRSVRWSTVRNKWQSQFSGAHVETRRGWRMSAREYHMGIRHGSEKPSLILSGEWGGWRPDDAGDGPDDIAQEVADIIVNGGTPRQVAQRFPRWYIRNGAGVERLHQTLNETRRYLR